MIKHTKRNRTATMAGVLYLLVVLTGVFSLMYVPSRLFAEDDAGLTVQNIRSKEILFRLWIVTGLLCYGFFLFLPLVLYRLLSPVNENQARLMVLFAILSVPVYFLNAQNQFNILALVGGPHPAFDLADQQVLTQVMLYLEQYHNGMRIVHIFSGLWLFPFGWLVFKSGFLPKVLGLLLIVGGSGYLVNFLGNTLVSDYSSLGISSYIALPASIGEIGICVWLIIVGLSVKKGRAGVASA